MGKSVVFSRLTGVGAVSANFPGTTVEFIKGTTILGNKKIRLIDVPGSYSMQPCNKAEEVAREIIKENSCDIILHIIDATNLERNLFFALEVIKLKKPVIILLNKWDLAKLKGITIDTRKLSEKLGVKVIPFVAITGEGVRKAVSEIENILANGYEHKLEIPSASSDKWKFIGTLSRKVQTIVHKHPGFLEKLAEISISPITGFLIAGVVLLLAFIIIRFIGEGLINFILEPLYENFYLPAVTNLVNSVNSDIVKTVLLGTQTGHNAGIGVLTEGVNIALVNVLPYIFAFYLISSFLEDLGYLPRLAVLLDKFLHRLGLHGYAGIPMILGLGCKVPAIMSARILEGRRERIIVFAMILLIAPCMPQSALIFSVLAKHGLEYVFYVFLTLFISAIGGGLILNKFLKGNTPELFMEIPNWHIPSFKVLSGKVLIKLKSYLLDAVPMILLGILIINMGHIMGLIDIMVKIFKYPITVILGIPTESVYAFALGFLRKDASVAMLTAFDFSSGQMVIGCVFLSMYLPCMAALFMIIREAGLKDALKVIAFNLFVTICVCGILNLIRIIV